MILRPAALMNVAKRRVSGIANERESGQAMIESLVVILVVCFLLFSLLQLAHGFAGREVLRHAAARAARARAVGFNGWMCRKVMRVAAIPNAGKILEPSSVSFPDRNLTDALLTKTPGELWDWSLTAAPQSGRGALEAARIPDYLASENEARAEYILDYENWDKIFSHDLGGGGSSPAANTDAINIEVWQRYPLTIMVKSLFDWVGVMNKSIDRGYITLKGGYEIENHYPLYLDDKGY